MQVSRLHKFSRTERRKKRGDRRSFVALRTGKKMPEKHEKRGKEGKKTEKKAVLATN